jgi:hypothetical protein
MSTETGTLLLDLGILLWLIGTWFYEGHHRRCTVLTKCPKCGKESSLRCHSGEPTEQF